MLRTIVRTAFWFTLAMIPFLVTDLPNHIILAGELACGLVVLLVRMSK
mgnify:CR=1 FL=1